MLVQEKGQSFTFNQLSAHRVPQTLKSNLVKFQPLSNEGTLL